MRSPHCSGETTPRYEVGHSAATLLLGDGTMLLDSVDPSRVTFEIAETIPSPEVTHLRYATGASAPCLAANATACSTLSTSRTAPVSAEVAIAA